EERSGRRRRLERPTVVTEADDDGAGVDAVERLEEHLHAFVLDQLAEVDDGRLVTGEELREARRIAGIGMALVAVVGVVPGLGDERGQRNAALLRTELVDVDAGRD